jgi:hypothetical protein
METSFPQPAKSDALLKPSKKFTLLLMLVVGGFLAVALFALHQAGNVLAWAFALVCVALIVVLTLWLHPNSSFLVLNNVGFRIRHVFTSNQFYWMNIDRFVVGEGPTGQQIVRFFLKGKGLMFAIKALPDTYGLPAKELADLMTRWRDRALHGDDRVWHETCLFQPKGLFEKPIPEESEPSRAHVVRTNEIA